ncbi:hypothetical protein Plec18170_000161 [Paecilomyces lecythidis]
MGESLIAIAAICDISSATFSSILKVAYNEADRLDSPASLVLLREATKNSIHRYTRDSVTFPPIEDSFTSPFLGWSAHDIARFLSENAEGTIVDPGVFLIADDKTAEDRGTLLLVQVQDEKLQGGGFELKKVRLAAEFVNTETVAVSVAAKGVDELLSITDGDGVFRGGTRSNPPRKGGATPRKQL